MPRSGEKCQCLFITSYNAGVATIKAPKAGRIHSVIVGFKASGEFRGLAARTQSDYLKHIARIEVKFGTLPLSGFDEANAKVTRGVFKKWRDENAAKSARQADYAWSILGRICSWGKDRSDIDVNPCERGGRLYKADRNDRVWTAENEAVFIAKAPTHLHLALLLALWTGQRQGDLMRLTWSNYDGATLRLRQGKTGKRAVIPVGAPLSTPNRRRSATHWCC